MTGEAGKKGLPATRHLVSKPGVGRHTMRVPFSHPGRRLCTRKRTRQQPSAARWSAGGHAGHTPGRCTLQRDGAGAMRKARTIPSSECHAAQSRPTTSGESRNRLARCGPRLSPLPARQGMRQALQSCDTRHMVRCRCPKAHAPTAHRHERPTLLTDGAPRAARAHVIVVRHVLGAKCVSVHHSDGGKHG